MYDQKTQKGQPFNNILPHSNHFNAHWKLLGGKRSNPSLCISFFYLCINIQVSAGKSILGNKTRDGYHYWQVLTGQRNQQKNLLVVCTMYSFQILSGITYFSLQRLLDFQKGKKKKKKSLLCFSPCPNSRCFTVKYCKVLLWFI